MESSYRQILSLFLLRGGAVGVNFLAMLILAALLPPADYGSFVLAWSLALFLSAILSLGVPVYLLTELAEPGLDRDQTLFLGVIAPLALGVILCGAAVWMQPGDWIDLHLPTIVLLATTMALLSNLASLWHGFGWLNPAMALRDAAPQGLALCFAIGLWMGGLLTPQRVLLATTVAGLILAGLGAWLAVRANRRSGLIRRNGRVGRYTASYWGGGVTGVMWAQIDILIGGALLSSAELGVYNIIRRICNLVTLPVSVATWLTVSQFALAARGNDVVTWQFAIRQTLLMTALPGVVLILLVAVLAGPVGLLYGFDQTPHALWAVLLVQAAVTLAFAPTITMANTSELEHSVFTARLLGMTVYCFAFLGLGASLEANALALLIGSVALSLWTWWQVRARTGLDSSVWQLVRRA